MKTTVRLIITFKKIAPAKGGIGFNRLHLIRCPHRMQNLPLTCQGPDGIEVFTRRVMLAVAMTAGVHSLGGGGAKPESHRRLRGTSGVRSTPRRTRVSRHSYLMKLFSRGLLSGSKATVMDGE